MAVCNSGENSSKMRESRESAATEKLALQLLTTTTTTTTTTTAHSLSNPERMTWMYLVAGHAAARWSKITWLNNVAHKK